MLRRLERWLRSWPRGVMWGVCLALVAIVGLYDHLSGYELSLALLFLGPIALGAWFLGSWVGLVLSVLSAIAWVTADITSGHVYSRSWIPLWNGVVSLGFFLVTAGLLVAVRRDMLEIDRLARTDPLTGVLNGRTFRQEAERMLDLCSRERLALSVVFLDLDDFKQVNDRCGHAEGDRVLRAVAATLLQSIRRNDLVGRLGGDEFALVLPGADHDQADAALRRLIETIAQTATEGGQAVSCSAGAVSFVDPPATVDEALTAADVLMYQVKARAKGTYLLEDRA